MMVATKVSPAIISYERPPLYPKQRDAIFCPERYAIIEASTKSGKTYGALAWLVEQALISGCGGRNYWWVAPIFAQSKIAFRRLHRALRPIESMCEVNLTELNFTMPNGAIIWFKGGDHPDSLYGEDVYAAVIDEASRVKEESWHAIRTTLTATQGPIRVIGNVKGRKNWFYRLARRAEEGAAEMAYSRITARDAIEAGVLSDLEVADAARILPESVFRELYEAEAGDDEGNPFGIEAIQACIIDGLSVNPLVAMGIDLAKSVDWTVVVGLDGDGSMGYFDRFQSPWLETIRRIRLACGETPAMVDSTGVGDPITEALQREGRGNFEGYHFTSSSKQKLMEGLALAIHERTVRFPLGPVVTELEQFEYSYTRTGVSYSAPQGLHDDCVCALALAVERRGRPVWGWGPA